MAFSDRFCFALLLVLLLGSVATAIVDQGNHEVTVLVVNTARVSSSVLDQAEIEVSRIYLAADIDIVWVNCSGETAIVGLACRSVPGPNQFVLHIVPTGKTSADSVFGLAFLDPDGSGKYSNVFYERIERAHRQFGTNVSALLGAVAAHELGHLLLGSNGHSYMGIMSPDWEKARLREMGMGRLLFTQEQSSLMKARLSAGDRRLALLSAGATN